MSVIASQIEVVLKLEKGWVFEDLFSISWKKKSEAEAVLTLHGLAVGKTMDYITEIKLNKSDVNFELSESIPFAVACMKYTYDDKEYSILKNVSFECVENEDQKGEADPQVEESYSKAHGARIMEKAKDLYEQGDTELASMEIKNYHEQLEENDLLSMDFKMKITNTVKMENVRGKKDFIQVKKMMNENAYNPAYHSFTKMNPLKLRIFILK